MSDADEAAVKSPVAEFDPVRINWEWSLWRAMLRIVVTLMFDVKVYNRHHIPKTGGVLMISNHQSYADPVLIGAYLRRPMSYLAKSELFRNRIFGWWLLKLRAFPVKQGTGDVGAVKETIRRLKQGHMLNIFAEGGRCSDGEIGPIQSGAALVVKRAGVPIVPCVIDGAFEAWPSNRKFPKCHPIRVMYGPPLDVEGMSAKNITALIDRTLRAMFAELRAKRKER